MTRWFLIALFGTLLVACNGGNHSNIATSRTPTSSDSVYINDAVDNTLTITSSSVTADSNDSDTSKGSTSNVIIIAWDAPVAREDEFPLGPGEIAGYRIYYGTAEGDYRNRIDINDGTSTSTTIADLPSGTYYFVLTTYDLADRESEFSSVISMTI